MPRSRVKRRRKDGLRHGVGRQQCLPSTTSSSRREAQRSSTRRTTLGGRREGFRAVSARVERALGERSREARRRSRGIPSTSPLVNRIPSSRQPFRRLLLYLLRQSWSQPILPSLLKSRKKMTTTTRRTSSTFLPRSQLFRCILSRGRQLSESFPSTEE